MAVVTDRSRTRSRALRRVCTGLASLMAAIVALPSAQAVPLPSDWQPPVVLASSTQPTIQGQTAAVTSDDGTSAVAWVQDSDIRVSVRASGTNVWGTPVLVSGGITSYGPVIAIGADGTIAVAWQSVSGSRVSVRRAGSTTWSAFYTAGYDVPKVLVTPDGAVTAVAERGSLLQVSRLARGSRTWSTQGLGPARGGLIRSSGLSMTPRGHLALVWTWLDTSAARTGERVLTARNTGLSTRWSAVTTLAARPADSTSSPTVVAGPDGRTNVIWDQRLTSASHELQVRTLSGTTWSAVKAIARQRQEFWRLTSAVQPNGTVLLAWLSEDQAKTTTLAPRTSVWSPVDALTVGPNAGPESDRTALVGLAAGPRGSVAAVWFGFWRQHDAVRIRYRHASGDWSAPFEVADPGTNPRYQSYYPALAIGGGDRSTVAWLRVEERTNAMQMRVRSTPMPPVSLLSAARMSGTVRVGTATTCSVRWADAATVAYRWTVAGRTVSTRRAYTPAAADRTRSLVCAATARNEVGSQVSRAPARTVGTGVALRATKKPTVTGTPKVGTSLKVSKGTWTPKATAYTYQWYRGSAKITGSKGRTGSYKVVKADVGKKLSAKVTARRPGHQSGSATTKAVTGRR